MGIETKVLTMGFLIHQEVQMWISLSITPHTNDRRPQEDIESQ